MQTRQSIATGAIVETLIMQLNFSIKVVETESDLLQHLLYTFVV